MASNIWQGEGVCNLPFAVRAAGHPLEPVFTVQVDSCVATVKDQLNGLFFTLSERSTVVKHRKVSVDPGPGAPTYSVVTDLTEANLIVLTALFRPDLRPQGPVGSWPEDKSHFWKRVSGELLHPDVFRPLFKTIGEAQVKIHYNYLLSGLKKAMAQALAIPEFSEQYAVEIYKEALAKMIMDM